ncbi:MAG: HAD-IIA family hydrolase [Candidatus Aenigmatarchaeota archaeon]
MVDFKKFNTFIFDLDGTVWNWVSLLPGVKEIIQKLKKEGKQVLFVSNNSMLCRKKMAEKLRSFGIELKENDLITSSFVAANYLKIKDATAFPIGEGVKEELEENGVKIDENKPEYLVVGQDLSFNYEKLMKAYEIVKNGAKILATARGKVYFEGEKLMPATGVWVSAIEYITDKKAKLIGKPSNEMLETIQLFVCSPRKETVLIGDECDSDIMAGKILGYYTVLVKTGIDKEAKKVKPDLIIDSLEEIKI